LTAKIELLVAYNSFKALSCSLTPPLLDFIFFFQNGHLKFSLGRRKQEGKEQGIFRGTSISSSVTTTELPVAQFQEYHMQLVQSSLSSAFGWQKEQRYFNTWARYLLFHDTWS